MRHEKSARLIELARLLAATSYGLTLDEMGEKLDVKRRTIERMRDQLMIMYPDLEEISDPPTKRWRLPKGLDIFTLAPTTEEMAALTIGQKQLERTNPQASAALASLETKMLSALKSNVKRRLATDLEALMQAEAIAVQPGPRASVDKEVLKVLRDALLALKQVVLHYSGGTGAPRQRILIPYGILFGGEAYLIAREADCEDSIAPRMWRLDRIAQPKMLDLPGGPPDGFDLQAYSQRSFGIYQEDTVDVVLRVLPDFVEEASRWMFHAGQILEAQSDGSLLVRLHGGGLNELAWSLFRWGGKIEILEPPALKRAMANALDLAQTMLAPKP
ncbi:helix-turn-helix transcriptional regulator [Candidatus Phycosocius spiralis]|uniref:DNA-binding transcriptional regulator n=1 Tax=Candidatus Phycosocius spiralis TaxID=2815099 RepID=A0ABQ4PX28_9PROT|nr:WYL domain-containing protein [Candidatus Phycosocius spiralis]GIU67519.1 DNA-binding transcriptional regulator [Candidatus Phycosocius spiralis]